MTTQVLCTTCGQNEQWHHDHKPRHAFTNPGEETRRVDQPAPTPTPRSGDPLLRLVLMKKGLICQDDFDVAERFLSVAQQLNRAVLVEDGEYKLVDMAEFLQRTLPK